MRWPLSIQIFLPFAVLLSAVVASLTALSSWTTISQSYEQTVSHSRSLAASLRESSFPVTQVVAQQIAAMIDGEVIKVDMNQQITASTLKLPALPAELAGLSVNETVEPRFLTLESVSYAVTVVPRLQSPQPGTVYLLLPQESLAALQRRTIWQTIAVAGGVLIIAMALAGLLARRIGKRVNRLSHFFDELATGQHASIKLNGRNDEVSDLMVSANTLSDRLHDLQTQLQANERLNLLSQLSGGLAHQLRNSITGSRMAIQLHQRKHADDNPSMLNTAIRQLQLTEEQVNAVLSLKEEGEHQSPEGVDLRALLQEVAELLEPQCVHWKTTLEIQAPEDSAMITMHAPKAVKGAILNLVLNAVEAAGTQGTVRCCIQQESEATLLQISDTGPGFPDDTSELLSAFQTTKPEGIGIGLTIAKHAFQNEGAALTISRENNWTQLTITFPQTGEEQENATRIDR